MSRNHLYGLVLFLTAIGLSLFVYKAFILKFPLTHDQLSPVWDIEAQISFLGHGAPTKSAIFIPQNEGAIQLLDENFISFGYGLSTKKEEGNRKAIWSVRKASGRQRLFYRATIRRFVQGHDEEEIKGKLPLLVDPQFEGGKQAAAEAILAELTARSADSEGIVLGLLRELASEPMSDNLKILIGRRFDEEKKALTAVSLLSHGKIISRVVHGIRLSDETRDASLLHWIEVFRPEENRWQSYDLKTASLGVPEDYFIWWRGSEPLLKLTGGDKVDVTISVARDDEELIQSAVAGSKKRNPLLLEFSLFSLPLHTQAVYRIILMIPLGAFLIVILRNVVGLRMFGTFMPVLVALAFRETELLWGIVLFTLIVSLGLVVRFYFEHLKLLLVPRLAGILIVVILIMVSLSTITHKLGLEPGLSVALFPMIIMTMTVERMSLTWDEQGALEAIKQGFGSLVAASLCYLLMSIRQVQHLFFVFPELLLIVLALTLLLGRYTGYRLLELKRFRALVQEEV